MMRLIELIVKTKMSMQWRWWSQNKKKLKLVNKINYNIKKNQILDVKAYKCKIC